MRTSRYIHKHQAETFIEAARLSNVINCPWNTFVTVNVEQLGIAPEQASKHCRESLGRLYKYHIRSGCPWCMGWVLENSRSVGVHAHILTHRNQSLKNGYRGYGKALRTAFNVGFARGTIKTMTFWQWRQSWDDSKGKVIDYCLKGIRPQAANLIDRPYENQGIIYGKRIGVSRNVSCRE